MDRVFIFLLAWIGGFMIGVGMHDVIIPPKAVVENCHIHQQAKECHNLDTMEVKK